MPVPRIDLRRTALLVVDMQEKLLSAMHNAGPLLSQARRLLDAAQVLDLPVLATLQYPKGLGPIVAELSGLLGKAVCCQEKLVFSACVGPIRQKLVELERRSVLVCGVEAHVCVLQTCLDLLEYGLQAFVVVDAIGSRHKSDQDAALSRMIQAGVVPTTVESALLELVHEAGGERFKKVLPLIK